MTEIPKYPIFRQFCTFIAKMFLDKVINLAVQKDEVGNVIWVLDPALDNEEEAINYDYKIEFMDKDVIQEFLINLPSNISHNFQGDNPFILISHVEFGSNIVIFSQIAIEKVLNRINELKKVGVKKFNIECIKILEQQYMNIYQ